MQTDIEDTEEIFVEVSNTFLKGEKGDTGDIESITNEEIEEMFIDN